MDKNDVIDKVGELLVVFDRALKVTPSSKPKQKTLLTEDLSKEQIAENEAIDLDWERFQILLDTCFKYYIRDDTKSDLESFCKIVVNIGNDYSGATFKDIPFKGRDRLIGKVIREAVDFEHGKKKREKGDPVSHCRIFSSLVRDLIAEADNKDGLKGNKKLDKNAYTVVADLIYKYGITNNGKPYKANTICNW